MDQIKVSFFQKTRLNFSSIKTTTECTKYLKSQVNKKCNSRAMLFSKTKCIY